MAATTEARFTASVHGAKLSLTTDELKQKLFDMAACDKKTQRVTRRLELVSRLNPHSLKESTRLQSVLNQLKPQVVQGNDTELVQLFRRAVRNHDAIHPTHKADPVPICSRHYRRLDFKAPETHVTLDVRKKHARVITELRVTRETDAPALILDGREHKEILSVRINGQRLKSSEYCYNGNELIIFQAPKDKEFTVRVKSVILPQDNKSCMGLYPTNGWLVSQCEAEGARRIFFTLDRPDNLSKYTTTIIADKELYPQRISNGNLLGEETVDLKTGHSKITWVDPFPKPSYLFAAVLGDFGVIEDTFTTRSGREVQLQVYVEKGKEERAVFAMWALKKAMEYDEKFHDREYDLDTLKMVGVPDFNMGAMENKGVLIFNDTCLLTDPKSGTDHTHIWVADVVGHEYFHNWSGNRVTVRDFGQAALKEAFTDWRAQRFVAWLFGPDLIRPMDVTDFWNNVVPKDQDKSTHPIMVEEYTTADEVYDLITYRKGREVFGSLESLCDSVKPEGRRQAFNAYFDRHDGMAVTFEVLLGTVEDVLETEIPEFRRWFSQAGTPVVTVRDTYNPIEQTYTLTIRQSCPSPHTGKRQQPFYIPLPVELLAQDGSVMVARQGQALRKGGIQLTYTDVTEKPIPVVLHGYSAPVLLDTDYSNAELVTIIEHHSDPFNRWRAARCLAKGQLRQMMDQIRSGAKATLDAEVLALYRELLSSATLDPAIKGHVLRIPAPRAIMEDDAVYDFATAAAARNAYKTEMAAALKPELEALLSSCPSISLSACADDAGRQIQLRELRATCLSYLAHSPDNAAHMETILAQFGKKEDFNERLAALSILASLRTDHRDKAFAEFEEEWKGDLCVYNKWLTAFVCQAGTGTEVVQRAMSSKGFVATNANHMKSTLRLFSRLAAFHDDKGDGYRFLADWIEKIDPANSHSSSGLVLSGFTDYQRLAPEQKALMREQLQRLASGTCSVEVRGAAAKYLAGDCPASSSSSSSAALSSK